MRYCHLIPLLFFWHTASAQAPSTVSGDIKIDVNVESVINAGFGDNVRAEIFIGSTAGNSQSAGIDTSVTAGVVVNVVGGSNACGKIVIGSSGVSEC